MARENGRISSIGSPTSGELISDSDGSVFTYENYLGPPELQETNPVSFDNDGDGIARNVQVIVTPPTQNFPNNNDYPGATIITAPHNGNLNVASNTVTIVQATTVTGSVTIEDDATFILKSNDAIGTIRAKVTGNIKTHSKKPKSPKLIIYASDVDGSITINDPHTANIVSANIGGDLNLNGRGTNTFSSVIGKTKVRGAADFKSIEGLKISDVQVSKNVTLTANDNMIINTLSSDIGNIVLTNNTKSTITNVTISAPAGKTNSIRIEGCTAVLSAETFV